MFSAALIQRIHAAKSSSLLVDARELSAVVANLTFLHDSVVASEQLLIEAAKAAELCPAENFNVSLAEYYMSHLEEERHHLKWLKEDLLSAGVDTRSLEPNPIAMAMVGTQYYMMKHLHPAALLGYLAVVEGDPVPGDIVDLLEGLHGKELMRFIRFHSEKDLEHRIELIALIDRAPRLLQKVISSSADNTLLHLSQATAQWVGCGDRSLEYQ